MSLYKERPPAYDIEDFASELPSYDYVSDIRRPDATKNCAESCEINAIFQSLEQELQKYIRGRSDDENRFWLSRGFGFNEAKRRADYYQLQASNASIQIATLQNQRDRFEQSARESSRENERLRRDLMNAERRIANLRSEREALRDQAALAEKERRDGRIAAEKEVAVLRAEIRFLRELRRI